MRSLFKKVTSVVWGDKVIPTMDCYSKTMRMVIGALLGSSAVIFQAAGVFTGIGYALSMMSTGPLVLASLMSIRIGVMTYFLTLCLLAMFQPSELLVFVFTTGLLGLSLGFGLKYVKRGIFMIPFAAFCLTLGIAILLYGFKFPILGPSVKAQFSGVVLLVTFAFALLYSWIWKRICITAFKLVHIILSRRRS